MFKPIKNEKKYMLVVNQIKSLIEEGKLKDGDKLPSERELSNQFGLSRTTIRESLSALEILGFVEVRTGLGTFVCSQPSQDYTVEMAEELDMRTSPTEIFEARIIVEPSLSRLAAQRATSEDLQKMEEIVDKAEKLPQEELSTFEALDNEFHLLIAKATYNEPLFRFAESINHERMGKLWGNLKLNSLRREGRMQKYKVEHRDIYNAIRDRNSKLAEELTKKHLIDIRKHVFGD